MPSSSQQPTASTGTSTSLPVENIRQTRPKDLKRGPLSVAKVLVDNFSSVEGRRDPSTIPVQDGGVQKTRHVRLITVGLSHYCEKIRWMLDLLEADPTSDIYYTEDAHPPAFTSFATVPASNGQASRAPMIVLDSRPPGADSNVLFDSTTILQTMYPELYPEECKKAIIEFEEDMCRRLGPTARAFVYHQVLRPEYYPLIGEVGGMYTSKIEAALLGPMLPKGLAKGMRKLMGISDDAADISLNTIREVFKDVSKKLDGGTKEYIFDSDSRKLGFTAADIAFAALASPLIRPPEMDAMMGGSKFADKWPETLDDLRNELRATPAGKHVLKMYKYHRFGVGRTPRTNDSGQVIIPKSVARNRIPGVGISIAIGAIAAVAIGAYRLNKQSRL